MCVCVAFFFFFPFFKHRARRLFFFGSTELAVFFGSSAFKKPQRRFLEHWPVGVIGTPGLRRRGTALKEFRHLPIIIVLKQLL